MSNRKSLIFILPLIALVLMACRVGNVQISRDTVRGSGNTVTEEREVSGIERVSLTEMGELTIIQGDEEGLTVEADDNLMRYIETEMRGSELVLSIQDGISLDIDNPVRYTLRVKDLNRISISGSGDVYAQTLEAGDLALEISGSGNMKVDQLTAEDLTARASGSGNYDLKGTVQTQDVVISGAGNFVAGDLASNRAKVNISGAGNVTMWVEEELDIRITGFGNVNYYGKPDISQSISGGGGVKSLGEHK